MAPSHQHGHNVWMVPQARGRIRLQHLRLFTGCALYPPGIHDHASHPHHQSIHVTVSWLCSQTGPSFWQRGTRALKAGTGGPVLCRHLKTSGSFTLVAQSDPEYLPVASVLVEDGIEPGEIPSAGAGVSTAARWQTSMRCALYITMIASISAVPWRSGAVRSSNQ
jgi:hypothetical protein